MPLACFVAELLKVYLFSIVLISLQVNALNDSHAQLMVHWLGEGTDVMICLAREPPLGPMEDAKMAETPSPSAVFISYDYGDTFQDKTDMFKVSVNGSEENSTLDQFITHPKFNTVIIFFYLSFFFCFTFVVIFLFTNFIIYNVHILIEL